MVNVLCLRQMDPHDPEWLFKIEDLIMADFDKSAQDKALKYMHHADAISAYLQAGLKDRFLLGIEFYTLMENMNQVLGGNLLLTKYLQDAFYWRVMTVIVQQDFAAEAKIAKPMYPSEYILRNIPEYPDAHANYIPPYKGLLTRGVERLRDLYCYDFTVPTVLQHFDVDFEQVPSVINADPCDPLFSIGLSMCRMKCRT